MKNYGKGKPEKSSLEKKLDIPLPLSVIWYIVAVFLLFYGLYILGVHFLAKQVVSKGGEW